MNEFDRDILKAIEGFSSKSPQNLSGILAAVDARQRVELSHEELASGLARLIDEDAIEPLIEMISRTLEADGRAEVNGCEHGQGQIDVLIFGKETDPDTDDIDTMIRPIVTGFACPPGSCIIRQYEEPQREVTSDLVPGD